MNMKKKGSMRNNLDFLSKVSLEVEKCSKEEDVDRISELPNDILVSILSLLTFREAAATKILSSRWARLGPASNVVSLGFPFPLTRQGNGFPFPLTRQGNDYIGFYHSAEKNKISDYISRTNHALDSYEGGQRIDKVKIDFPCVKGAHWNKWLEFALSKETKIMDIRTIYCKWSSDKSNDCCSPLVEIDSTLEKSRNTLSGLKYLKVLSLSEFRFTFWDNILTNIISKFDDLECLSIESPQTSSNHIWLCGIDIDGRSLKLKYLSISNFAKVSSIRIRNMVNLVSLRCHGLELYDLYLVSVPKLVDVSIIGLRFRRDDRILYRTLFNNMYAQLLRLRLYIRLDLGKVEDNCSPTFTKLKHMELDVVLHHDYKNGQLYSLIRTCHSMEELEIKFLRSSKMTSYRRMHKKYIGRKAAIGKLKTLRLSGYTGSMSQLEFVLYVVSNATNLKDLIIVEDGHENHAAIRPKEFITRAYEHLRSAIAPSVNFISSKLA